MTSNTRACARRISKLGVSALVLQYLEISCSLWQLRFFFGKALDVG